MRAGGREENSCLYFPPTPCPVGSWVVPWFLQQHLSDRVTTALLLVKLSKGRGRAAMGNLGVQWDVRFWAEKRRRKKTLVPRQWDIRNQHFCISLCVIIACWLAPEPGCPKRTKPHQFAHQPVLVPSAWHGGGARLSLSSSRNRP